MKVVTWNINGLRSSMRGGIEDWIDAEDPDIICLQETRCKDEDIKSFLPHYHRLYSQFPQKGRAGVAILSRYPIQTPQVLEQGRLVRASISGTYVYSVYTPHGYIGSYTHKLNFLKMLSKDISAKKSVVVAGDFNIALEEIDTYHDPCRIIGCKEEERAIIRDFGLTDTFRSMHPNEVVYSSWSNRLRKENRGWRIDYILISEDLELHSSEILERSDHLFKISDHMPVIAKIAIP